MTRQRKSSGKRQTQRYKVMHKGQKVAVTVPDEFRGDPVQQALRENLSDAVLAGIAAHLLAAETRVDTVTQRIHAFARYIVATLGDDEFNRLCEQLGL